jgi:hypothetical protein
LISILFPLIFAVRTGSGDVRAISTFNVLLLGILNEDNCRISTIIVVALVKFLKEFAIELLPDTKGL